MTSSFTLREYHDFEPDEQLLIAEPSPPLDVRAFELERATQVYVQHLPVEHGPAQVYPWRDRAWQGDWLWQRGGLSPEEALFWLLAMTHPLRHEETQLEVQVPELVTREMADQPEPARDVIATRIRAWFEQERRLRPDVRWFAYTYLTRLLVELFSPEDVLDILMDAIPSHAVRHFFIHLQSPLTISDRLAAQVCAIVAQVDITRSLDEAYTAVRLLERIPVHVAMCELATRLDASHDRAPTLVRDVVNLFDEPSDFATWFNRFEDYHIAQEMIPSIVLRGGFDVVGALMRRVVQCDDAFVGVAFKDLLRIHSWRAVEGMLELSRRKMFFAAARDWLVSNHEHSVKGLLEIWLDSTHALSGDAFRFLDEICARGHNDVVERHAYIEQDEAKKARIQQELVSRFTVL